MCQIICVCDTQTIIHNPVVCQPECVACMGLWGFPKNCPSVFIQIDPRWFSCYHARMAKLELRLELLGLLLSGAAVGFW